MEYDFDLRRIIEDEINWPKANDRAFLEALHWSSNAYSEEHPYPRLIFMIDGYKISADVSVDHVRLFPEKRNRLLYPIIFNYRHFIELSLKHLIGSYGEFFNISPVWTSHDILYIWKVFWKIAENTRHEKTDFDNSAESIVKEFSKIDPKSQHYRYPVDSLGKTIPLPKQGVDLLVLKNVMDGLYNYFQTWDAYLEAETNQVF